MNSWVLLSEEGGGGIRSETWRDGSQTNSCPAFKMAHVRGCACSQGFALKSTKIWTKYSISHLRAASHTQYKPEFTG